MIMFCNATYKTSDQLTHKNSGSLNVTKNGYLKRLTNDHVLLCYIQNNSLIDLHSIGSLNVTKMDT